MRNIYSLCTKLFLVSFAILQPGAGNSQVKGCRDPMATNYKSAATVNDGSCQYNPTSYTPPIKVNPMDSVLVETSGLQMAGNYLWSFNDGGGQAAIYRIDTLTKTILQTVHLPGTTNVDWEDIAFDGSDFYIGDFGNNRTGTRKDLKIYRFPLSAIPDYHTTPNANVAGVTTIPFTYSNQPPPTDSTPDHTRFDCEAMIVDGGSIHLFTKNWIDHKTTHYVISNPSAVANVASPVDTLDTGYLVTGADKAPGQQVVALIGYLDSIPGNHFMHLLTDYGGGKYFNGNKRKINLPDASVMGQAEGITFRNGVYGYISNEKFSKSLGPLTLTVTQKLRTFNISAFTPQYVLPLQLKSFSATNISEGQRVAWSFATPVQNLSIQYSTNGVDFTVVKSYNTSIKDFFLYQPANLLNYYRLAWKSENGAFQYSNVVSIKGKENSRISNMVLRSNGDLTFIVSGTSAVSYSFKLTNTDGKELSHINEQQYKAGTNRITFLNAASAGGVAFLTAYHNAEKITRLLPVRK